MLQSLPLTVGQVWVGFEEVVMCKAEYPPRIKSSDFLVPIP